MNDSDPTTTSIGNYLFKNSNNESSSLFKKMLKTNDSTPTVENDNCSNININNNNNNEHKLLNDLLSKPISSGTTSTTTTTTSYQQNNNSAISSTKLISNIYNNSNRNDIEMLRKKYLDENILKTKNDDLSISFGNFKTPSPLFNFNFI